MGLTSSNEAKDHYPLEYYGGARTKSVRSSPEARRNSIMPTSSSLSSSPSSSSSSRSRSRTLPLRPNLMFASTVSTNENVDHLIPPALRKKLAMGANGANSSDIKETFKVQLSKDVDGNKTVNEYTILKTLGSGSYGKVKLCIDNDGKAFALKIMNKSLLRKIKKGDGESAFQDVLREVAILKRLKHPNVVRMYEVMDDPENDNMFLVMEYVEGGQVLNMRGQRSETIFDEIKARKYMHDIIRGLEYLHSQRVIHRDIKPENLLLANDTVKLSDFGVSTAFKGEDDAINVTAGTPAFMSPEACAGKMFSGKAADIWALGVTLFIFVLGVCPFRGDSIIEMFNNIQQQPLKFPANPKINSKLKDLLTRMLEKDPKKRIKLPQIKTHPWMIEVDINTPRAIMAIPKSEYNANARQDVSEDEVNNAVIQMKNTTDDFIMLVNVKRRMSKRLNEIRSRSSRSNSLSNNGDDTESGPEEQTGGTEQAERMSPKSEQDCDAIISIESDDDDDSSDNDEYVQPPRALST